jgi:trehalose utilization protein
MNTSHPLRWDSLLRFFILNLLALIGLFATANYVSAAPIRVVVWDERQDAQKKAYTNNLGDTLAKELEDHPEFKVKSVGLNDPDQGLTDDILDNCDVLIWWGHQKHAMVTPEHVKAVVDRVKAGKISLIALHSAHWSKPFVGCMNERAIEDALKSVPESERDKVKVVTIPWKGGLPKLDGPTTPSFRRFKADDGTDTLEVTLPGCIFPVVANLGLRSHITTAEPQHPIAAGIPATFDIPQTEIYGGTFHVPKPDAMIFGEKWDNGQSFTSGCAWKVGKGKVFYFRPGHETYPILLEEYPLKIVVNAIKWANEK